ncbi:Bud-site selection protein [Aspergillus avenaceus]|uniref:Bud-site selection protein n=1 Tax=Aspergillus avenaceus TaxID=36643 RepID=A0A5N6TEN4_ASPAV|nr:Bud-site selection protein [Aspergillus avenaceus]
MPKRKLSDVDGPGPKRQSMQAIRLGNKFEQGVTQLSRAIKTARGFERQKLGRREKTAKAQGDSEALARLGEEITFLKGLDPSVIAQKYLFKQLVKTKRIAETSAFVEFQESRKIAADGPRSTAEANVLARLYKSTPVKNVFPNLMTEIRRLLKLDDVAGGDKKKAGKEGGSKDGATKVKSESRGERVAKQETVSDGEEEGVGEEMSDVDFGQFDARLAPDSEDEEEAGSGSDDASDGGVDLQAHSETSISRSPSPDSPPAKKQKAKSKTASAPATSTTFLPSLTMGGYWSGESEPEEVESAEPPRRKNRMGQQARRALWEKKFGSAANHVKQQMDRRGRDSGWDMRRGATDGTEGPYGRRGQGRGPAGRPHFDGDRPQRGPPRAKPEDNKPLHPSWEAAKKAKEQKATASFQGKKVTFD